MKQELVELFYWLKDDLKISSKAFSKLQSDAAALQAVRLPISLATARANVAALQEVLHMTLDQVRFRAAEMD